MIIFKIQNEKKYKCFTGYFLKPLKDAGVTKGSRHNTLNKIIRIN